MKQIEFNENNLGPEDITKTVKKVRAFVVNEEKNQVLLVYYAGLYMLPGGSIDKSEDVLTALSREILEESGIEIDATEAVPFLKIESYDKNYFDRKNGLINRLTETFFFEVKTTQDIDESKKKLTASEKEQKHSIFLVDLNEMQALVESNQTDNPKRKQFDREILVALNEYLEYKNSIANSGIKVLAKKLKEDRN